MAVVLQMLQQNDDKHEAGHARLRGDWRELEKRVMALERAYTDAMLDFARTKTAIEEKQKAGVDIVKLRMSLPLVGSILAAVVIIVSGAYGSASWVKSDIQALRGEFALETRINDERNQSIMKSIDELRKRQELVELELRNNQRPKRGN